MTITVTIDTTTKQDDPLRHICRSWRMDSSENWLLAGDVMIGYGKQWLEKGRVMQQATLTIEGKGMVHGHRGRRTLPHVVCSYIQRKVLKYIS